MSGVRIHVDADYEDPYVQPVLVAALRARLPPEVLVLIGERPTALTPKSHLLQWKQYESLDFDRLLSSPNTMLANSYVIRKALIRKHYLSATVSHWSTKHPRSSLRDHFKPGIEFELDYAEFMDDALVEAYELKESWADNEGRDTEDRQWWILKPGMSDRGQGLRLFSSEEELSEIFEEWDPASDEEDEVDAVPSNVIAADDGGAAEKAEVGNSSDGIITSQLRHFVAQPYIHPPLLLPPHHSSAGRKFHIRTYVLAVGALKVFVYRQMLALFAGQPYRAPGADDSPNDDLPAHLTNTCMQNGEREGSVHAFWSLPDFLPSLEGMGDWREHVFQQICDVTGELFEAAARSMGIHFQPLPNAFELYGVDFLLDASGTAWLLEVNAFPDFAQTGDELQMLIEGLFEWTVELAVKPFFGLEGGAQTELGDEMVRVLDIDLGKR